MQPQRHRGAEVKGIEEKKKKKSKSEDKRKSRG
jgi:hypothetical protein